MSEIYAAEKTTAATAIYSQIKDDLFRGAFAAGTRMNIKELSERYDTSINPVREALSRLAAERIIEQHDQRGFSVPKLDVSDLEVLVRTRCWLEEIAMRESIANKTETFELNLITAYHRLAHTRYLRDDGILNPDWEKRHSAFHSALLANCGSPWLLSFCDQLMFQATRARHLSVVIDAGRLRNAEHEAIMIAAISGNADEAVSLLKLHYGRTFELVQQGTGGSRKCKDSPV